MIETRPRINLAGLMLPAVLSLAGIIYIARQYGALPPTVPMHFDGHGAANGVGPKSQLWILPAVALVMNVVLAVSNLLVLTKPSLVNLPVRLTPENRGRVLDLAFRMLVFLRWVINILFAGMMVCTVEGARTGVMGGLNMVVIPSMVLLFGGTLGYVVAMRRAA